MKKRLRRYALHIGRATWHVSRWTLYISATVLVLLAIAFIIARFTLPMIEERKPDLEQYLSQRSGHQVQLESLHAYWEGLHPGAKVMGLQVYAADGLKPAIRLSEVRISLALLPLLWGNLEMNSLLVVHPSLALERLDDGRFRISGFDASETEQRSDDADFVGWLFRQNRLEIENGELQWFDHRETRSIVHLSRVNMSLRNNGDRHRLGFSAEFPQDICRECSLVIDITGNPFTSSKWDGDVYLRAEELNTEALPLIAREKLPKLFRGKFNAQLWSEWDQGRPASIRGNAHVTGLRLPVPGWGAPLGIREAGGDLSWKAKGDGWRLDVANPVIGLTGTPWAAEHLRIEHQPEESRVRITHVNLGDITGFTAKLKKELTETTATAPAKTNMFLDYWLVAKPEGALKNVNLRVLGKVGSPEDVSLEADLSETTVLPYKKYPGVQGLSGHLSLTRQTGSFRLDSGNITVSLPQVFRSPLVARRATGDLRWERTSDFWQIKGNNLRVISDDARGAGKLTIRIPLDKSVSPYVNLRVDFQNGNGAHAARYYPASHLSPSTLAWMERSFVAGEITQGYLIYDGPIRDFPFRHDTGKFELQGHVRNGVYRYLPGWEPIKQAEVDVVVKGSEALITGSGKIGKLDATQVTVQSRESDEGHHMVHVSGKVSGPLNETLNVLRNVKSESETARWLAYVPSGLQGQGDGVLSLNLNIPLHEHATRINGEYRFQNSTLLFPSSGVAAESIEGSVSFTEEGIREGGLRARLFGGPTELAVGRQKDRLRIHARGTMTAQGLAPVFSPKITPRIAGNINWMATWLWNREKETGDLSAEADLKNLKLSLPPPLDWPDGLADGKLVIRTELSTNTGLRLDLGMGDRMHGKLVLARDASAWKLISGRIGFGEARVPVPREGGLHVSAHLDALDLDQWWPWLGGGPAGVPGMLTHVSAEVRSLGMFDRNFGDINFDIYRSEDVWSGTVGGASMAGSVKFSGTGSTARFDLDLTHLILPDKQHRGRDVESDPRRLPAVQLRSKSFQLRDKSLGELDFVAIPRESGWSIERFNLARPEMKLNVKGNWQLVNNKHASEFDIEFKSSDMGKTMEAFGVPDQMAGGDVSVTSHLAWPGSPTNPQLATLSGSVEVTANKGRFLQVKRGAGGRLFGLLDLSAISRYLLLDFSPVFGKGLIYDRIEGKVSIDQGNALTQGFSIRGPATQLDIGGRIGLAAEDYDLTIEVQPKLTDTLTLASWGVWGPQVAAVVLAVQKIFKKQISAGTHITYVVKGPWDKPVITKLVKGHKANTTAAPAKADDEAGNQ